jgi:hypothetical protein
MYKKNNRDQMLGAFVEGCFFGFVVSLLIMTFSSPSVKTVTMGFFGYVLFVVLRGLLDYNHKRKPSKGK